MLEFYKYPDAGVVNELIEGASLVREVPQAGMLPLKFMPALLTESALGTQSSLRRSLIENYCIASGDAEIDEEVWKQTLEECGKKDGYWVLWKVLRCRWTHPSPSGLA